MTAMTTKQMMDTFEAVLSAPDHKVVELTSPVAVILRCSCGWTRQFDRRQNALARVAKVRAAKREHEREAR